MKAKGSLLPAGWTEAPIGSLCSLNNGRAFKPTEWSTAGIPIVRIQNLNNRDASFNYFAGDYDERYHLKGGELLFAWSGTPGTSFGAHIWTGAAAVLNQHIFRVDFDETAIEKRFFRLAINQKLEELIGIAHGGVGLRHVTKGKFERTLVSIPPRNEQKRIADKLDALLARVDACREHLDRVPAILKRFRESVLAAATSGRLTEEWREKTGRHEAWIFPDLSSLIVDGPKNGMYKPSSAYGHGTRILRIDNFYEGAVTSWADLKRLEVSEEEGADFGLAVDDIVINRVNSLPYLGKAALVRELPEPCVFESNMMRVRLDKTAVHPEYCILVLSSPAGLARLRANAKHAVNQASINQTDVGAVSVPLPRPDEQVEIVRRVDALFAYADRMETSYTSARVQAERLTPSLLVKAFRGELVSPDRTEAPGYSVDERACSGIEAGRGD